MGINLGTRKTFSDLAQTTAEYLGTGGEFDAVSFYGDIARQ